MNDLSLKQRALDINNARKVDRIVEPIQNYIYLYHVKKFLVIPTFPESISETTSISTSPITALGRSAPTYVWSSSGPRTVEIQVKVHRESMKQVTLSGSQYNPSDDYIDDFIKAMQACALPNYRSSQKLIDPPMVALRYGNDFYIKGVISSGVTIGYELPILSNGKFAIVNVGFGISEVTPFTAEDVMQIGSYRDVGFDDEIQMDTTMSSETEYNYSVNLKRFQGGTVNTVQVKNLS